MEAKTYTICAADHVDNGTSCYRCVILTVDRRFSRRTPTAVPTGCDAMPSRLTWLHGQSYGSAITYITKYNRDAKRRGWSTWAVLAYDNDVADYLLRVKDAEIGDDDYNPEQPSLALHGFDLGEVGGKQLAVQMNFKMHPADGKNLQQLVLKECARQLRKLNQVARKSSESGRRRPGKTRRHLALAGA